MSLILVQLSVLCRLILYRDVFCIPIDKKNLNIATTYDYGNFGDNDVLDSTSTWSRQVHYAYLSMTENSKNELDNGSIEDAEEDMVVDNDDNDSIYPGHFM